MVIVSHNDGQMGTCYAENGVTRCKAMLIFVRPGPIEVVCVQRSCDVSKAFLVEADDFSKAANQAEKPYTG